MSEADTTGKKSISEVDWDDDSPFRPLGKHGFFAYAGSDGDLLRKNGLPGWRVSVHGRHRIRIQKKGEPWKGRATWKTIRKWEVDFEDSLSVESIDEFEDALDTLVETGDLERED